MPSKPNILPARADPDRGAPRAHPEDPAERVRQPAEGVPAGGRGPHEAALPRPGRPPAPPLPLPPLPQAAPAAEHGGGQPQQLPDHAAGGHTHGPGIAYTC